VLSLLLLLLLPALEVTSMSSSLPDRVDGAMNVQYSTEAGGRDHVDRDKETYKERKGTAATGQGQGQARPWARPKYASTCTPAQGGL